MSGAHGNVLENTTISRLALVSLCMSVWTMAVQSLSRPRAFLCLQWSEACCKCIFLQEFLLFPNVKIPASIFPFSLTHWSYSSCGQGDRSGLCSEALLIGESNNRKQLWREEILLEYRAGCGRTGLTVFSVWVHSRPLMTVISQTWMWLNFVY